MKPWTRVFGAGRSLLAIIVSLCSVLVACAVAMPAAADSGRTLALGDSVMLGAREALHEVGVQKIDAKVSRQASTAAGLLRERGSGLQRRVVIHLGTNGSFTKEICRSIMKAVGPDRRVFLVNIKVPRRWEESNNKAIDRCAAIHADQVTLVDWHRASTRHPQWLYSDGLHLRPLGARGYARLIADAILAT
ncbi:MAG: hypothetical protein Q8L05_05220 [Actinomycetota bacterium]|nr:hypothetical protein [Actinomycetota bacterium]MDP2287209.1 hypothetical protein [Actinomycetota bacterium]